MKYNKINKKGNEKKEKTLLNNLINPWMIATHQSMDIQLLIFNFI